MVIGAGPGRAPQAAAPGRETVGAKTDGFVAVDEHMRVPGLNWLYVVGDLNGRALFTTWRSTRRPSRPGTSWAGT